MAQKLYLNAAEVAEMLGIGLSQAYRLMRVWNEEIKQKGYLVIAGKIPIAYFSEKIYGGYISAESKTNDNASKL